MPEPTKRGGPSGWLALGLAASWFCAWWCCLPPTMRTENALVALCCWGAGMAVCLGVAVASIRRGPQKSRWAAYLALFISAVVVGFVLFQFVVYLW